MSRLASAARSRFFDHRIIGWHASDQLTTASYMRLRSVDRRALYTPRMGRRRLKDEWSFLSVPLEIKGGCGPLALTAASRGHADRVDLWRPMRKCRARWTRGLMGAANSRPVFSAELGCGHASIAVGSRALDRRLSGTAGCQYPRRFAANRSPCPPRRCEETSGVC
jgi:hypothetical protein